jgi:hypothetical protein
MVSFSRRRRRVFRRPRPRFSRRPLSLADSAVVLREWGFSTAEIDALFDSGAAVQQRG